MKILLISWMLVLAASLSSGHYIYKVEKENAPAYEVKSNLRGAVIVNSKFEKPTLKDILYHDLIQPFFGKEEPVSTERAFTNSHGLPFLEELDKEYTQNDELKEPDDLFEETEPKPLTDEAVKEAYKTRSYLFDQMRQRNDVISPDLLERKKRQAEKPFYPEPPRLSSDTSYQAPFVPNTYGMNLNPGGGYMWNNINKPSLFEVGQPFNGYENAFPNPPQQTPAPEDSDSDSSEDIYVNVNRPSAQPLETEELTPENEAISENPAPEARELTDVPTEPNQNESEPAKATEIPAPVIENDAEPPVPTASDEPEAIEATEANEARDSEAKPEEPVLRDAVPVTEVPSESSTVVSDEGRSIEEAVIPEGDKVKEMPEAPTLPPLNYDNLPDDVRRAISSTERIPTSEEQELEDILATAQPVEGIPKTYGMNLTSGGGKVWNDLVNPPVSYEVGTTERNQPEEAKETTPSPAIIEEPTTAAEQPIEPGNPEEPEKAKEPANPETPVPEATEPAITTNEPYVPENEIVDEKATELPDTSTVGISDIVTETEAKETTPSPAIIEEPTTAAEQPIEPANPEEPETAKEPANPETPVPEVTEPATTTNEPVDEKATEQPDTSTVEISDIGTETEANNENNLTTELPAIIEPGTEPIESITEETTNSDLPDISTTESTVEDVTNGNDETVEPVTDAGDPENPEEPETGSGEPGDEVEPEEQPDIMSELLKSEQFWQWLGEWMASYTELMEKHIRKIAVQEICKSRQGDICPLNKPEDSGSIIKDDKVTIDGKDVKGHLNQLRRGNKGNSVDATTIYGNSVGNEQVTNVFIFNSDAKDILEGLKPDNNNKVNIIVENKEEGRSNIEDIEAAVNTEVPELEATTEITELSGIEDRGDGTEAPKVEDVTTEEPISENKEADVKDVEKVTEEPKEDATEIADVREVTELSESGIENTTEAKLETL